MLTKVFPEVNEVDADEAADTVTTHGPVGYPATKHLDGHPVPLRRSSE
jgi:hypothetical protein